MTVDFARPVEEAKVKRSVSLPRFGLVFAVESTVSVQAPTPAQVTGPKDTTGVGRFKLMPPKRSYAVRRPPVRRRHTRGPLGERTGNILFQELPYPIS
jgi:hypothetical protein